MDIKSLSHELAYLYTFFHNIPLCRYFFTDTLRFRFPFLRGLFDQLSTICCAQFRHRSKKARDYQKKGLTMPIDGVYYYLSAP